MRTLFRTGVVSILACIGIGVGVSAGQPTTSRELPSAFAASDGAAVSLSQGGGVYRAVHFLAGADDQRAKFVRDYLAAMPAVAGVRHWFIYPGDPNRARGWSDQFAGGGKAVVTDPGHALARALNIPVSEGRAGPATVVLDASGTELFRHQGSRHDDHLRFEAFATRMERFSRREAIHHYNLPKGSTVAVEGFDVVAYHRLGKAIRGRASLVSSYRGVTYHFASEEHRDLFAAAPEKYLPTYGGWCASAMGAKGTKVAIDPTNFKVKDGRLHLFYKGTFSDALKDWNKHEREWEPAADVNWKKLTGEEPVRSAMQESR